MILNCVFQTYIAPKKNCGGEATRTFPISTSDHDASRTSVFKTRTKISILENWARLAKFVGSIVNGNSISARNSTKRTWIHKDGDWIAALLEMISVVSDEQEMPREVLRLQRSHGRRHAAEKGLRRRHPSAERTLYPTSFWSGKRRKPHRTGLNTCLPVQISGNYLVG